MCFFCFYCFFFYFNDTATTEIYTLSLHDALPICGLGVQTVPDQARGPECETSERRALDEAERTRRRMASPDQPTRSEEHTSELQSRQYLVCRLLLEKKKTK